MASARRYLEHSGRLDDAIAIVEQVVPTTVAAVSLAELYVAARRWGDLVTLTNGVTNGDDSSALLLVYRACALRRPGPRRRRVGSTARSDPIPQPSTRDPHQAIRAGAGPEADGCGSAASTVGAGGLVPDPRSTADTAVVTSRHQGIALASGDS